MHSLSDPLGAAPSSSGEITNPSAARPPAPAEPRVWTSAELLGEGTEARIVHLGATYRLMLTRNQKLILVK